MQKGYRMAAFFVFKNLNLYFRNCAAQLMALAAIFASNPPIGNAAETTCSLAAVCDTAVAVLSAALAPTESRKTAIRMIFFMLSVFVDDWFYCLQIYKKK
ncbi:MAG: hypothetical protein CFE23_05785 [Flavobacterium sp. BFFFF1]|nr:MAG: hypothetical protein CFE23_05785 [Flavobacterium sp. BFFFF1]